MSDMSSGIDLRALFTDESALFRTPEEPDSGDTLTVRFRTRKGDVDRVIMHVQYDERYKKQTEEIDKGNMDERSEQPDEQSAEQAKQTEQPAGQSAEQAEACPMSDNSEETAAERGEESQEETAAEQETESLEKTATEQEAESLERMVVMELVRPDETPAVLKDSGNRITKPVNSSKSVKSDKDRKNQFDSQFDFYEGTIEVGDYPIWYYFTVEKGQETIRYSKLGVTTETQRRYGFVVRPDVHVPEWSRGAIFYQIFVDRFYNGDPSNDVLNREYLYVDRVPSTAARSWDEDAMSLDVGRFYGGDLQGVIDKLDYIQSLQVDVIYFNPIFVSPSNHKYDIQDYDYVDPHYGVIVEDEGELLPEGACDNFKATRYITRVTNFKNLEASNELFATLCEEAHKRGMRVVLDGVFNHCGSFNKWLDKERIYEAEEGYEKGAYVSKDSPYRSFFLFRDDNWPYNDSYKGWWDHDTLPKLNYEDSPELCDYVMKIGRKWVSEPFCVDGWRLDVAADLGRTSEYNHKFWKRFRENVKDANKDALILAEHYGDASDWLQGDEWDTIMNYDAFMEPVTWFLTGLEKHSEHYDEHMFNNGQIFYDTMRYNMCRLHRGALLSAMNELSNHDHSRFMTRTNRKVGRISYMGSRAAEEGINKGIFREGIVIQMTWPGAPTIYYGDETGLCGWTDPDSRRTYPWGHQDLELIEFHKYMAGIHRRNPALQVGSLKFLGYGYGILMYGRFTQENRLAVAINNQDHEVELDIPVWEIGMEDGSYMLRVMSTSEVRYNVGVKIYPVENGVIHMEVSAYGAVVVQNVPEA